MEDKKGIPLLRMTIGAAPTGGISLDNELRLIKAALLYADHSVLYSPGAFLINSLGRLRRMNDAQTLASILPAMVALEPSLQIHIDSLAGILQLVGGTRAQRRSIPKKHRESLSKSIRELREKISEISDIAGLPLIEKAISSGLLDVYQFKGEFGKDEIIKEYLDILTETVISGKTFPLFDEQSGSIVTAGVKEGVISPSPLALGRGKQTRLASYLFERLPLFDAASIDEVIDIRKELERPLVRFRAAMMEFSAEIKHAAWDKDFTLDAEDVFIKKIEPAILDIEDTIRGNRSLAKLAEDIATKSVQGSLLAIMLDGMAVSETVSCIAGLGTMAGLAIAQSYHKRSQAMLKAEQNYIFYYYKLRKELS